MENIALDENRGLKANERKVSQRYLNTSWKMVWKRKVAGWRGGLLINTMLTGLILLVHTAFLIWTTARFGGWRAVENLYQGRCDVAERLSDVSHAFINILSCVLLGAANYAMQILAAPTRNEIDKAHSYGISLDVGVQSMRNIRFFGNSRIALWIAVSLSSITLHLVYGLRIPQEMLIKAND